MLRRVALILACVLLVAVIGASIVLIGTHIAVRREAAPLPTLDAIAAVANVGAIVNDAPVRVSLLNTASQSMPRRAVLDAGRDPHGDQPYVMSYPAFALEWKDGRLLLVDAGMTRAGALAFGRPIEWLGGADPIVAHGSVADTLGDAAPRVKGVVFTHLHSDHVGLKAFEQSKTMAIEALIDTSATKVTLPFVEEQAGFARKLMGEDFWPYGIGPNRKALEAFLRHHFAQGLSPRLMRVEEMFDPGTHESFKI